MTRYRRPAVTGNPIFFTVCLADRSSDLLVREVAQLRLAVREAMAERPFVIDAWVVLPDHLHAVWTLPAGDRDFGTRWGAIKSRFSRSVLRAAGWPGRRMGFHPIDRPVGEEVTVAPGADGATMGYDPILREAERSGVRRTPSKVAKGDAGIWQRRFWEHHIRDERDYDNHVRYCLRNPVKHGLVSRAVDWPHSSIHRDIRAGRVEAEWVGAESKGAFGE